MARGEVAIVQKMPILVCSPARAFHVKASLPSADNRGQLFFCPPDKGDCELQRAGGFLFCLARNRSS